MMNLILLGILTDLLLLTALGGLCYVVFLLNRRYTELENRVDLVERLALDSGILLGRHLREAERAEHVEMVNKPGQKELRPLEMFAGGDDEPRH